MTEREMERKRTKEGVGSSDPELYMLLGTGGGSVPMVTFSQLDLYRTYCLAVTHTNLCVCKYVCKQSEHRHTKCKVCPSFRRTRINTIVCLLPCQYFETNVV